MKIVEAITQDASTLTEIAFAAKRQWNYPEHYYEIWKNELTITPEYILGNRVYVAKIQSRSIGFYSITENLDDFYSDDVLIKKGYWLEHIFVLPDYQRQGIGVNLVEHAKSICRGSGIQSLHIFVDPFSRTFYDKIKAVYLYDSRSSVPDRDIPVYKLIITK